MKYSIVQRAAMVLMMGFMAAKSLSAEKPDDSRPNVIFILADDAGFGDFGSYGQSEILTPNLDRMSEEGIRFTDHYAGAPVCSPSRSALLTGQHTGHTPIRGNKEIQPEGQYPLPAGTRTVGTMLQEAGIQTAVIGKWGLGYPGSSGTPDNQGFDYFFGYNCQRQAHDYYPDHIWENEKKLILDGKTYTHDLFTEKALSWIEEEGDAPFFLYLAYTIPHAALQVPDLEPYQEKDWPENMKKYAAMITRMDRDIGKILSKLKEQGIDNKTLILFSSDNGPHAEGGADPAYFKSGGPFRGIKRDLYEGGIRIPLIARWPGVIQPERETDHISAFWDFLPTIAEIYNIPLPEGIDGISYLPVLKNQEDNQKEHDYLYWEFHENGGTQAVRMGDWKGVRKFVRLLPSGPIELYNLADDPGETNNIAGENKEIVSKIDELMAESHIENADFPLLGKTPFRLGLENGWLFLIPFGLVMSAIAFFRRKKDREEQIRKPDRITLLRGISTAILAGISFFSPMMVMAPWFYRSVAAAVTGILVYGVLKVFNRNGFPGAFLFWIALGAVIPSWPFIAAFIFWTIAGLKTFRFDS